MIRVAFLDDHPAVRAGLQSILAPALDLHSVGSAANEAQLWRLIRRSRPHVVILDVHHPGRDGLTLSLQIKREPDPPAVVLYSASTDPGLTVAAAVAGANAVVTKSSSTRALLEAIRSAARTPRTLPPIPPRIRLDAAARLDPADHAILAMRLADHSLADIGELLRLSEAAIADRIAAIVAALASARPSSADLTRHPAPASGAA